MGLICLGNAAQNVRVSKVMELVNKHEFRCESHEDISLRFTIVLQTSGNASNRVMRRNLLLIILPRPVPNFNIRKQSELSWQDIMYYVDSVFKFGDYIGSTNISTENISWTKT